MTISKPFTVTTTIVTTIDPGNPEHMDFQVGIQTDSTVEIPQGLLHGIAQAACEHTFEKLAETSVVGVMAEVVEEETSTARCPVGNLLRYHPDKPCETGCDVSEIIEAEVEDLCDSCEHPSAQPPNEGCHDSFHGSKSAY